MKRKRQLVSFLTVEPECCFEAVRLWENSNAKRQKSDVTEKARRHLSAMGWKFWYTRLKYKTELRYESPSGKVYNSLRTACKAYLQKQWQGDGRGEAVLSGGGLDSNLEDYTSQSTASQPKSGKGVEKRKVVEILEVRDQILKPKRGKILADLKRLRDEKLRDDELNDNVDQVHDRNDEICTVCRHGGELILCDRCPSAFHTSCLGLRDVVDGDWFCPSCCRGICGSGKSGGCSSENRKDNDDDIMVVCDQCEHKFHGGCLRNAGVVQSGRDSEEHWFCSRKCGDIFLRINKISGKPISVGTADLTWTLLKPSPTNSKLNLALSVMHECFEPSKDPYTQRDIVEDVIFSRESELTRLNFKRFYTVVLERSEELITVGTIRIYSEVAEVPLVATRFQYRRLGMCRIWMNELEKQLMKLGVGRLVLPSAPSALDTWTGSSFGFSKMTAEDRLQFVNYSFLDFTGTTMCHKLLKQTNTGPKVARKK